MGSGINGWYSTSVAPWSSCRYHLEPWISSLVQMSASIFPILFQHLLLWAATLSPADAWSLKISTLAPCDFTISIRGCKRVSSRRVSAGSNCEHLPALHSRIAGLARSLQDTFKLQV